MEFKKLTDEQKKSVIANLDTEELACLQKTETILQKIAGAYINTPGNPEMADLYRNVAGMMSELQSLLK